MPGLIGQCPQQQSLMGGSAFPEEAEVGVLGVQHVDDGF